MADSGQIMLGKMNGELPPFTCHCGPQLLDGGVRYLTFNEDESKGRTPVQTSSEGDYPSARDLGVDMIGMAHDCSATYQRSPDGITMSG